VRARVELQRTIADRLQRVTGLPVQEARRQVR
jgi:hypothetical protein